MLVGSSNIADIEVATLVDAVRWVVPPALVLQATRISTCAGDLFTEEAEHVAAAVSKRRTEFTAGRVCARAALARLGIRPMPVPVGSKGEPVWPPGIVGSITHDMDLCIVALQSANRLAGIGIDITENSKLGDDVTGLICTPREIACNRDFGTSADPFRIIFSLKESIYKCLFPFIRRFLDFHEVEVALDPFSIHASEPAREQLPFGIQEKLCAAFCVVNGCIFSAAWVDV